MTREQMAAVTFENYDPNFNTLYQKGDVVVGGLNFGTGSSREQAATALKFKGIPCVIAGSFSETYKRNAFNNGFVVFECPELVTHLRTTLTNRQPTTVGPEITIDYARSVLTVDGKSFPFPPLSPAAQELIVAGGAEKLRRFDGYAQTQDRRNSGEHRLPGQSSCRQPVGDGCQPSRTFLLVAFSSGVVKSTELSRLCSSNRRMHSASRRMQHANGLCSPELVDRIRVICVIRGRKNSPALAPQTSPIKSPSYGQIQNCVDAGRRSGRLETNTQNS